LSTEFIVSLLGHELLPEPPVAIAPLWRKLSANVLYDEYVPAGHVPSCACHHFWIDASGELKFLRRVAGQFAAERLSACDIAVQPASAREFRPRLIAFDLDSTLINVEVIDELARLADVHKEVAQITEAAMRGEIEFQQAFRQRIALLRGLEEHRCRELLDHIQITEGAEWLIRTLHARGCKTAVLSGGFSFAADWLKSRLPIDYVLTNVLPIADSKVTGEVTTEIVDGAGKAKVFREFAEANSIPLTETVAVGDGANDLPMMALAGLSVAFRAKPKVREQADVALSHVALDGILHLIAMQ
jgi:phosphoserine phosphatase